MNGLLTSFLVWLPAAQISAYGLPHLIIAVLLLLLIVACVWLFALKKEQRCLLNNYQDITGQMPIVCAKYRLKYDEFGSVYDYCMFYCNPLFEKEFGIQGEASGIASGEQKYTLSDTEKANFKKVDREKVTLTTDYYAEATQKYYDIQTCPTQVPGEVILYYIDITDRMEASKRATYYANRFLGIFNNLPVATGVLDKNLTIADTNKAFDEIIGIDPQEYKERKVSLLDNPLYTDEEKEQILQGTYQPREKLYDLNKMTQHGYLHCNRKETKMLWTVFKAIKDADDKEIEYYLLMLIDHSKINTLLNNVLDHLPIPIMVKDAEHGFRYVYWNIESELQSQISRETVVGKTDFDFYPPERAAAYRKIDEELLVSRKFMKEETYQLPTGEERSSIVMKSVITSHESGDWILVARWDITEQKKAEQKIKEAMNQTRMAMETNKLIFDNLNIGLVYVNMQYVVQWESVANLGVLSLSQHYIPGKPCYETVYGRTEPCIVCPMTEMIKCRHSINQVHCIGNRQVDITSNPVYDKSGTMIGAILRLEDITEKKRIEVELEAAKESNKLKSAFLANMSHEIRTPLNAIVGFSNILINTENVEEKKEYAEIIGNNNELLLQLISDILDLSKIESDTLEFVYSDVDINTLINGIAHYARIRKGSDDIEIHVKEELSACVVHTEKNRLSQVLMNLITNALKFTTKGSITTGYHFIENNSLIYFYVIDTGCGIEKNKINTIFDRFVKLNSFSQGTGLGLSICRTIVERLGGDIGVESIEGQGSKFWFTIPYQPTMLEPISIETHTEEQQKKVVQ